MAMQNRKRLLDRLKKIQGAPRKAMRAALEQGAQQVASHARSLAPKKSGALVKSIGYTFGNFTRGSGVLATSGTREGDPDLTVTVHAGDATAFYASYVEFGTSPHTAGGKFKGAAHPGATAQPFFFPAWRANKRSVKARITRAMRKAIKDSI